LKVKHGRLWTTSTARSYEDTVCEEWASAFTVAELGEKIKWKELFIFGMPPDIGDLLKDDTTHADFYDKVLIYLVENKLVIL
jgi:hypothetical protein